VNGIYGGRLEYNVTAFSEYCSSYSNFTANAKASYNTGIASISGGTSHEKTVQRDKFLENCSISVITYGGSAQDGSVLSPNQQGASNLQQWRDSVQNRSVLVAFGEAGGLIPIWELCNDAPNGPRATELRLAFAEYAKDKKNVLEIRKKAATVYEHVTFEGKSYVFDEGNYSNMGDYNFNDIISSIEVEPGFMVKAYEHANYSGKFDIYEGGTSYYKLGRMNDKISSMKIEKVNDNNRLAATIYKHDKYDGASQDLTVGIYPNMGNLNVGNDAVSSIKVTPGYKVLAYEHADFKGKCVEYTSNTSNLGSFNDKISSIKVVKI